jgi:hypothetical protein
MLIFCVVKAIAGHCFFAIQVYPFPFAPFDTATLFHAIVFELENGPHSHDQVVQGGGRKRKKKGTDTK